MLLVLKHSSIDVHKCKNQQIGEEVVKIIFQYSTHFVRSSRPDMFCKKGAIRNFAKFTAKHVSCSLRPATLLKQKLCHRCFSQNTFFDRKPLMAASVLCKIQPTLSSKSKIVLREKYPNMEFFSGPYFPAFGLNTERYGVSLLNTERYGVKSKSKIFERALNNTLNTPKHCSGYFQGKFV